jgi:hypothetical protein
LILHTSLVNILSLLIAHIETIAYTTSIFPKTTAYKLSFMKQLLTTATDAQPWIDPPWTPALPSCTIESTPACASKATRAKLFKKSPIEMLESQFIPPMLKKY